MEAVTIKSYSLSIKINHNTMQKKKSHATVIMSKMI